MTKRVSVPGRNISSSQCGIRLNIENPRIRYRPSSDFTWMSLMTSGVKMLLRPRTDLAPSSVWLMSIPESSEDELALGRLEVVVVPELAPAHEFPERGRRRDAVDPQLAFQQFVIGGLQPGLDAVHAQRRHPAAHVDGAVVHGVAEPAAHVAADDLAAPLQHEPGHGARV